MTISSRAPEGLPGHCVLCGRDFQLEFSESGNAATCPSCGYLITQSAELLDEFKSLIQRRQGTLGDEFYSSRALSSIGIDSLETVEFVMELEEKLGLSITEEEAIKIKTVGDAIRYILDQRRRQNGN